MLKLVATNSSKVNTILVSLIILLLLVLVLVIGSADEKHLNFLFFGNFNQILACPSRRTSRPDRAGLCPTLVGVSRYLLVAINTIIRYCIPIANTNNTYL